MLFAPFSTTSNEGPQVNVSTHGREEKSEIHSSPSTQSKKRLTNTPSSKPLVEWTKEEVKQGKIAKFNSERGFGFIKDSETHRSVFFHVKESNVRDAKSIVEGATVLFKSMTPATGYHQGKERATDVVIVPNKPLGNWGKEEVLAWFLSSKYADYAKKFSLDGKDLAGLTKEDFLHRCPEMGDVIYNAIQALKGEKDLGEITRSKEKQLEQKAKELETEVRQSRSLRDSLRKDPRYELLYNKTKREMLVHGKETFIPQLLSLPPFSTLFGAEFAPKGFESEEKYEKFLLTKERYSVLKEIEDFILGTKRVRAGFTPSGPHGIGKSGIGLLLACYAFLNNHFLVYIPLCGDWVGATHEDGLALEFLKKFRTLNADLASQVSAHSKRTLLELASSATKSTAIDDMKELLNTLGSLKDPKGPAVFYILDEHNELYKLPGEGPSPIARFPNVLHSFTRWTALTSGSRTITIYIGSAHSKFEFRLPGGEEWRLKYLQPLTFEEAKLYLEATNFPPHLYKDDKGQIDLAKMDQLQQYTGYLPRELDTLRDSKDLLPFINARANIFSARTARVYEEATPREQQDYLNFLQTMLLKRYGYQGHVTDMKNLGNFYDRGLFYKSPDKGFQFISLPARNSTNYLLSKAMRDELEPIDSVMNPGQRGIIHEKWNIACFVNGNPITIKPFYLGKGQTIVPAAFTFKVDEIVFFDNDEDIPPNLSRRNRLYIPNDPKHPTWDCIFDNGNTTAFFSFSISDFWKGDPPHSKGVERSFELPKEPRETQNSIIMNRLRGKRGYKLCWQPDTTKGNNVGTLIQESPDGDELQNIHYFYGCGSRRQEDMEKEGGKSRQSWTYDYMKFFGREVMEDFGVKF